MGEIINARCPGCKAHGEQLFVGEGMQSPWPWEARMYVCDACNTLVMARMIVPLAQLRAVADGKSAVPEESRPEYPKTARELAQFLVDAKAWPACATCGEQLSGRARREAANIPCPRCDAVLVVESAGCWD